MSGAARTERFSRLSSGCRWLDLAEGIVWEVQRVYRRAIRLVSLHSRVTIIIYNKQRLVTAKGWRPLRGTEFQRSFEIVEGAPAIKLVRGRLPGRRELIRQVHARPQLSSGASARRASAHDRAFDAVVAGPRAQKAGGAR